MSIPILRGFISQNKFVKVSVLTNPKFFPLFKEFKSVNLIGLDKKFRHKGIFGIFRLSKDLKKLNIDIVIDLHNVLRTKLLKLMFWKPFYQINKGRSEKKDLILGNTFKQLKTTHQRYQEVFNKAGFLSKAIIYKFNKFPISYLKLNNNLNKKIIGIAPYAAYKSKTYSIDKMKKVIEELSENYYVLLFGGGEKETEQLNKISLLFKSVINVSGKYTLAKELEIMSNIDLMISMDSANGHIAALMGVKVLSLWGVTHPYLGFAPINQKNYLLADKDKFPKIPTSVYGNKYPKGYEDAINSISAKSIIEKVYSIL